MQLDPSFPGTSGVPSWIPGRARWITNTNYAAIVEGTSGLPSPRPSQLFAPAVSESLLCALAVLSRMNVLERVHRHGIASRFLTGLSDEDVDILLRQAQRLGGGIGGQTFKLDAGGVPVFAKQIPLTAVEQDPANVLSGVNLFDVPAFCHYGLGSPGFTAWREVIAHECTSRWVIDGECENFILMYHWRRVSNRAPIALPEELADIDAAVEFWGQSQKVRTRLEALRQANESIILFLEWMPQTVQEWLADQKQGSVQQMQRSIRMVDEQVSQAVAFMNGKDFLHFDAHFENILTDGRTLFLADFGLALAAGFDLSPDEAAFCEQHASFDRDYVRTYLTRWVLTNIYELDRESGAELLTNLPLNSQRNDSDELYLDLLERNAAITLLMMGFYKALQTESRLTPYPSLDG